MSIVGLLFGQQQTSALRERRLMHAHVHEEGGRDVGQLPKAIALQFLSSLKNSYKIQF